MTTLAILPAKPVPWPATARLQPFGATPSGEAVGAIELDNGQGIRARILTLGATLQSLGLPDRDGRVADVVLGFDEGVNVTVGLPFIRTSVDHGTVFGKAGKGTADPRSMHEAIVLAAKMAGQGKA